jgi:protein-S-isoprenylcysteine O-methyltransferase Ste14
MDKLKHIRSIIALPFMALVVIPAIIIYLTGPLNVGWSLAWPLNLLPIVGGALLIVAGLVLMAGSIRLFMRFGKGTLAPWDATQKLVVRGIYRYVRNPMHSGVFTVLYGEGLLLGSVPILIFVTAVVVLHFFYIPLSEERGLERRFGEPYLIYKQNVPRWIPRLTPWEPGD